jgi:hypothetical protein
MSRTDTYLCTLGSLGSSPPPVAPAGRRGVDVDRALVVRALARLAGRLPDDEELRSATASMMDWALETQAGSVKDGGVPGVAAAEVWLFWICSSRYWLGIGVLVEVTRRPTQPTA